MWDAHSGKVDLGSREINLGWSRQVRRGTIHHINPISASRMRLVPTPRRNNPTSAIVSHPVGINSLRSHSTVGKFLVDALRGEYWGIWNPRYPPLAFGISAIISPRRRSALRVSKDTCQVPLTAIHMDALELGPARTRQSRREHLYVVPSSVRQSQSNGKNGGGLSICRR
jgi:hypothetical protein